MASKLLEAGLLVGGVILAYLLIRYLPYLLGRLLDFLKIPHYARKPMDYEATKELEGQMLEKERLGSEANEVYQSRQSF